MYCPICNTVMEEGGIVTGGVSSMWFPMEQFNKKGIKKIAYSGGKLIGTPNLIIGQTKIANAYFCKNCNKIIGVFAIKNKDN